MKLPTALLLLAALAGPASAGGASFFPPADFRKTGGDVSAASDFLVGLESSSRFSATSLGSAIDDPTQDAVLIRPSGALSANYRPWAVYDSSIATVPVTYLEDAISFFGVPYQHGSLFFKGGGETAILGKESAADYFDIGVDGDFSIYLPNSAALETLLMGPSYGPSGGVEMFAASGQSLWRNQTGLSKVFSDSGTSEMVGGLDGSNVSTYSTGQLSVIARGPGGGVGFLQLESVNEFALLRGGTNAFVSALGGYTSIAASTSVRLGPGNSLVLPSDTSGNLNDNLVDVGSAANRFRTVRAGTSVVVGATTTYGDGTITTTSGLSLDGATIRASRSSYGPWTMVNLGSGQTNATMDLPTSTILPAGQSRFRMPFAGRIKAISVSGSAARTAGTATFVVFKNNASVLGTPSVVIDGTNTQRNYDSSGSATFVAGDDIDVRFTTTAAWAPTTAEWAVFVVVEWTS